MVKEEKISVIIPVYNGEKYIEKCLNSILSNTYKNLEVICINDGSKDNSLELLKQYENGDSRIHIINKKNEGVSAARNDGLAQSTGEYIAFVDIDDWVHVQYFRILMRCMKETGADLAACTYKNVFDYKAEDKMIAQMPDISILNEYEMMQIGHLRRLVWGRIYKRKIVQNCKFRRDITWGEDTLYNISVIQVNAPMEVAYIQKDMYYYFRGQPTLTDRITEEQRVAYVNAYLDCVSHMKLDKSLFAIQCCKEVLAYRYSEMFRFDKGLVKQNSKIMISKCRKLLRNTGGGMWKKSILFKMFFMCPQLYRCYRILDDPTLIEWEKRQKELYNEK